MLKPFRTAGALVTLSAMLALAACSGQSSPVSSADGSLRIGVSGIPTQLDPGQEANLTGLAIQNLVGGTLTNLNSDGKGVSLGLAETVTPGDTQYVIKLKPGLKFSDGGPLTATDVAASFEYYMNDKTNQADYTFTPIQNVTATDDLTVTFDLKRPFPAMEYALSYPTSAILPAKSIQARGADLYKGDPLPTAGKYQIQTFDPNQVVLQANPNYAGKQPSTKTLTFVKITDSSARLAQVQGGQIDYAQDISPSQIPQLSGPVEARTAVAVNGVNLLRLNNRDNSVLNDVRIRKAVSSAIDRNQINQLAFSGQNKPALGLFASSSSDSRPFLQERADVAGAKELLAGTKCSDGCTLRFIVPSNEAVSGDVALVVQQNLKEVGIQVNIEKAERAVVFQQSKDGNYDLTTSRVAAYVDIQDFNLQYIFGNSNTLATGYANPEMKPLLDTLQTATGSQKEATIDQINALFEKDLPFAPVADWMTTSASRVPAERFDLSPSFFFHVG